jgi:hypothetical protein
MNLRPVFLFVLSVVMIVSSGCKTIGTRIPPNAASKIIMGETSKDYVIRLFGMPTSSFSKDGKFVAIYWSQKPFAGGNHREVYSVLFDTNNIVKAIHFYERDFDIRHPETYGNKLSTKEKFDQGVSHIVKVKTKLPELIEIFGKPEDEWFDTNGQVYRGWLCEDREYRKKIQPYYVLSFLSILCDREGFVLEYRVTEEARKYALPF